ncbi:unnamed protein product [Rotaria sp. Silwood1]|nr:unnamed protein product [Rotaria sp. Silwood1]CAF4746537.1 unnamed protein product [Rotaria sp. Silwood1]
MNDRTDLVMNHHKNRKRNKKSKCSRRRVILVLLATFILIAVIAIIVAVLLIKLNQTTSKNRISEAILRWNTTGITIAGISNEPGNDSTHLNTPWDVTLDYQNSLYIADRNNHRIQKYLAGSLNGTTVAGQENGTSGSTLSYLQNPSRILIDVNGNMYITDTGNHRILSWSSGSSSGVMIAGTGVGGSSNNQLRTPYGIARDINSDKLYIADYSNSRIMLYLSGASSGTVIAGGNGPGTNATQLKNPVGLYFDSLSNSLVIANHAACNILRWVIGETSWTLLAGSINGTVGNTSTLMNLPVDITFDPMGNMYVADRNNHRIQLFMVGQSDGITIAGVTGISGDNATLLNRPWSIKLDSQLNLYVADSNNHRIQKFLRY